MRNEMRRSSGEIEWRKVCQNRQRFDDNLNEYFVHVKLPLQQQNSLFYFNKKTPSEGENGCHLTMLDKNIEIAGKRSGGRRQCELGRNEKWTRAIGKSSAPRAQTDNRLRRSACCKST